MIRRPPRSTLFPSRRSSDLTRFAQDGRVHEDDVRHRDEGGRAGENLRLPIGAERRSEEHTSELQSLTNLVCRLLLEKKKKKNKKIYKPTTRRKIYKKVMSKC